MNQYTTSRLSNRWRDRFKQSVDKISSGTDDALGRAVVQLHVVPFNSTATFLKLESLCTKPLESVSQLKLPVYDVHVYKQ